MKPFLTKKHQQKYTKQQHKRVLVSLLKRLKKLLEAQDITIIY
jgi:hypothetical protein